MYLEVPDLTILESINPRTIKNAKEFLQELSDNNNEYSRLLKEKLSPGFFECLKDKELGRKRFNHCIFASAFSNPEGEAFSRIVSQEIHDIVAGHELYKEAAFLTLPLKEKKTFERIETDKNFSDQLGKLYANDLLKKHKVKLNRLLLAEAYPAQLKLSNTAYENWVQSGLHLWGDHLLQAFNKVLANDVSERSDFSKVGNSIFGGDTQSKGNGQKEIVKRKTTQVTKF